MDCRATSHVLATSNSLVRLPRPSNRLVVRVPVARRAREAVLRPVAVASVAPLPGSGSISSPAAPDTFPIIDVVSPEAFEGIISSNPEKLVVLMCKATGCRPCKQFRRKYGKLAAHYTDAIFCEVLGDRSEATRGMMRSYKVRATPTFLFFRNGEQVHSHSGINAQRMVDALKAAVKPTEVGYCEEVKFAADVLAATEDEHH